MQKKNIFQNIINVFYGQINARQLKRKLATFVGIFILIAFLSKAIGENEIKFSIAMGILSGFVFYIPVRIKEYFGVGWLITLIITVAYISIIITFCLKPGFGWLAILFILLPVIDIGLSICAVIMNNRIDNDY